LVRLAPQSEQRVQLRWEGAAVHIILDGQPAAKLAGWAALRQGWSTTLANGRQVEVRTLRPILFPELAVLVDGRHVHDSPSHPGKMLRASAQGILIAGAIFLFLRFSGRRPVDRFGVALQILEMIGAAFLLRRMYVGVALIARAILADFVVIDLALVTAPAKYLIWPIAGRLFFTLFLIRAFIALRALRNEYASPGGELSRPN
jgi:hypothetical protein